MPRSLVLLVLVLGCAPEEKPAALAPARLVLSAPSVEFGDVAWEGSDSRTLVARNAGELPLGIGAVHLGEEESAFSVAWDACAVTCDGEPVAGCDATADVVVLDAGCELPLAVTYTAATAGDAYDAVVVETIADPSDSPAWHADPLHAYEVSYVHASTSRREPVMLLSPRSYDFGFVYPGLDETPARFAISNLGDADLTVSGIALEGCPAAYTLTPTLPVPFVLGPLDTTLVEVAFAPTDLDTAACELHVSSDDDGAPVVDATLVGNDDTAVNTSPTVTIRSPVSGAAYDTWRPLRVELALADAEQPASSLTCRVESRVLGAGILATCTPADSAGRVFLDIDGSLLLAGSDTLGVTVVDASGATAYASVSIRIDTASPADDDDGDGFGPGDCDDGDADTYPEARELADGLDNDCDGLLDEGTVNADDDGDGLAEVAGDCDDARIEVYAGAAERGDGRDNDCDRVVDEGTLLYDDDADGFSEVDGDCDDVLAGVHPGAAEACDDVDNDCDGFRDDAPDGCDAGVLIAGNVVSLQQTAVLEGETVWMEVQATSTDGAPLTYLWSSGAVGAFDDPTAARVSYTAQEVEEAGGSFVDDVLVLVTRPDGHQDWATGRITVHDRAVDLYDGE